MTLRALSPERGIAFQEDLKSSTLGFVQRLAVYSVAPRECDGPRWAGITRTWQLLEDRISCFSSLQAVEAGFNVAYLKTLDSMQTSLSSPCWSHLARLLQKAQDLGPKEMNISLELAALPRVPLYVTDLTLNTLAAHFGMRKGPRLILTGVDICPSTPSTAEPLSHLSNFSSMELIDSVGSYHAVCPGIPPLTKLTLDHACRDSGDILEEIGSREWPHLRFFEGRVPLRLGTAEYDLVSLCLNSIQAPKLETLSLRNVPACSSLLSGHQALDHLLDRSKQLKILRLDVGGSCREIAKKRDNFNDLNVRLEKRGVRLELDLCFIELHRIDVLSERHFKILYENRKFKIRKLSIVLKGCPTPIQRPCVYTLPGIIELRFFEVGKRTAAAMQWCMEAFRLPDLEILRVAVGQQEDPLPVAHHLSAFIRLLPARCLWQVTPSRGCDSDEHKAAMEFLGKESYRCGVFFECYWTSILKCYWPPNI